MSDESNLLPASRLVRWATLGVLICLAIALYFRTGTRLPSLTATPAASTGAAGDSGR